MTDRKEIDPEQYDLTEMDAYEAVGDNRGEKRSALGEVEAKIKLVRQKIRDVESGEDRTSPGQHQALQKRLTQLVQEAEEAKKEAEEAEKGFLGTIEELTEEVAPAFEQEWRGLHRDPLESLRRVRRISEALSDLDNVRTKVNRRVPDREIDENTTQAVTPFEGRHPAGADIREAVSKRRIERSEEWMEDRGYTV